MSTSNVAFGKLLNAKRSEPQFPVTGELAAQEATTDPDIATLRPLGGPKGSGLSLMIECLTSIAIGNPLIAKRCQALLIQPAVIERLSDSY